MPWKSRRAFCFKPLGSSTQMGNMEGVHGFQLGISLALAIVGLREWFFYPADTRFFLFFHFLNLHFKKKPSEMHKKSGSIGWWHPSPPVELLILTHSRPTVPESRWPKPVPLISQSYRMNCESSLGKASGRERNPYKCRVQPWPEHFMCMYPAQR